LDLSYLLGAHIPPELFELEWLESLIIRGDDEAGFETLTRLPPDFKRFKSLRELDISSHSIVDLSPLKGLNQLRRLDCSSNQVIDLFPLEDLNQLETLDYGSNQVADLSSLRGLAQLRALDCSRNQVADLKPIRPAICSGQIKKFSCYDDPVHGLPAELLGSHMLDDIAEALRGYWPKQGGEPNRDVKVKVTLVGNGCVGKTTLAYGLLHRHPPPTGIAERTHGIVTKGIITQATNGGDAPRQALGLWRPGTLPCYSPAIPAPRRLVSPAMGRGN
jgi:Leucine-rich repeat (LRR) protein